MRSSILHCLLASLLLLAACGDSTGDTNQNNCPAGFEQSGPACIPIFDDCPGSAEIPVLGGGCQAVGVTTCATGLFTSDGEGGCEPILPDHTCPPGTMEMLGQTECQPVGVTECAVGFESDGEGGCNAILPPAPCPSGTIALLGYTTCQPLGDCGAGTWGNIVDDGMTLFVDQTADATGANGTQQAPFLTIGEALAVALPGWQIAVAAGDYTERLTINREVRLAGRCAAQVTIRGRWWLGEGHPPVTIGAGGTSTTVRGITLTGPAQGIEISGAQQVSLRDVEIRDASDVGLDIWAQAEVALRRVVVTRCARVGVLSIGSTLEVDDCVIRDTRPQPSTGRSGRGISAECSASGPCGSLRVSSSLVAANRSMGIAIYGVEALVSASVVRNHLPEQADGRFGRGITAQCDPENEPCGSVLVSSSIVSGNTEFGILALGVNAELRDTVVSDTHQHEFDGSLSAGIFSLCSSATNCGSLLVDSCLVAGNRQSGISVEGVDAEVAGTVVRDTLPLDDGLMGRGISAQCDFEGGVCGSLLVSSSLVSQNRDVGIVSGGVDTEVSASVVRDTLPEQSTSEKGQGITGQCFNYGGYEACGSLRISSSLVTDNHNIGVQSVGVEAHITTSVIRDTRPQEADGADGWGVHAQCYSEIAACGSLHISSSLVSGNRDCGIAINGVDTDVKDTVIRSTRFDEGTGIRGVGVCAVCEPEMGACGSLEITSSLIAQNQQMGVLVFGVDTEIATSLVRDTLPLENGEGGHGIQVQCDLETLDCGTLRVSSSLVTGNRMVGIATLGANAEVSGTVLRNTLSQESNGLGGYGLVARCHEELGACGSLQVSACLVSDNRTVGIFSLGVDADIAATVVQDTQPEQLDGRGGHGIVAQCERAVGECGTLRVSNSLVSRSKNIGIYAYGVPATLAGVAVVDTEPNLQGPWRGAYGYGIWAQCEAVTGNCGDLTATSCLVDSSQGAGVAVDGVSGYIASSMVRSITSRVLDSKYGYGVQVGGLEGEEMPTFNIVGCEIRDAKLAGVLYYRSRGTLSGSVVSGGENSVVMNEGSEPTILEDNDLSGTVNNDPTWANLFPAPAPPPTLPLEPTE